MKEEEKQNVVPQIEEPLEGECESTRPRRNPDLNLKGHLKGWNEEGVYEFVQSVQHPEMKREVMHKTKHVTVSKTAGEKAKDMLWSGPSALSSSTPSFISLVVPL